MSQSEGPVGSSSTVEVADSDSVTWFESRFLTMEMNLQKIESVDVDQSLIGRIFDYGAVTIRGVGSSYEPLRLIDAPLKLRSTVTAG
jgi:Bacterial PH domain